MKYLSILWIFLRRTVLIPICIIFGAIALPAIVGRLSEGPQGGDSWVRGYLIYWISGLAWSTFVLFVIFVIFLFILKVLELIEWGSSEWEKSKKEFENKNEKL